MNDAVENSDSSFSDLAVASFESRRADDMTRLIERHGGRAFVSPSMRERPLEENPAAINLANDVVTGRLDLLIFLTGVGFEYWLQQVSRRVDVERLLGCLADMPTLVRGPKPAAAMRKRGLTPTWQVPEPNTWRELLTTLDRVAPVANQSVAVLEYGRSNSSLTAGLEARGARVMNLKVYEWELPEDVGPLEANARRIAAGEIDVALFTSAEQVHNLMRVAESMGAEEGVRQRLRGEVVVCSIGPTTSEALRELELSVDLEPVHPKMGSLVAAAAAQAPGMLRRKKAIVTMIGAPRPETPPVEDHIRNSRFLRACRRESVDCTPVWLMRQAGRYMPEYRAVREKHTFLELCKNPELSAEVMATAVNRLGVDAAIIFSDLLPILEPMGLDLEFAPGDGPQIHNPVREAADVDRVLELDGVEALDYVMQTIRATRAALPNHPIIGFAGAPFTLASYAIEGGSSRNFLHAKTLMQRDEAAWSALMSRLARAIARYLNAQIAAGAHAVQLFDSWVGCLAPADYRRYVAPFTSAVIAALPRGVPVIHFGTGNPALLPQMSAAGGDVIGVDWRIDLDAAWRMVGEERAVQGNLDPAVLMADVEQIRAAAKRVLDQADGRAGHIFNLGHGVLPQTPPDAAIALVEAVHELSAR